MFAINRQLRVLNDAIVIKKAGCSINQNHIASSRGISDEATAYLLAGDIDGTPMVYAVLCFSEYNDIYVSDELIFDGEDLQMVWDQGTEFLDEMGFFMDNVPKDELMVSQVFLLDDVAEVDDLGDFLEEIDEPAQKSGGKTKTLSDREQHEVIRYLAHF